MTATDHLAELGYVDPLDVAQQRDAEQRARAATLAQAESHLAAGQVGDAIALLQELHSSAPHWTAPRRLLARAELFAGRDDDALVHLNWLEAHGLEHAELALLRGAIELRRRQFDEALACAEYARALEQPLPAADVLAGQVLLRKSELDRAEAEFARALQNDPQRSDALAGLGTVALRRGDWQRAGDWILQALEQGMNSAAVHFHLGMALAGLGRLAEATVALQNAAKLDQRRAGPYRWLAQVAAIQGDRAAAEAYLKQGREIVRRRRAGALR